MLSRFSLSGAFLVCLAWGSVASANPYAREWTPVRTVDASEAADLLADEWVENPNISDRQLLEWSARAGQGGIDALFDEIRKREKARRDLASMSTLRRALAGVPALASEATHGVGNDAATEAYRAAGLQVLAHLGSHADLRKVFSLSSTGMDGVFVSSSTLDAFEASLDGILARHPSQVRRLDEFIWEIDSGQSLRLVRALGRQPSSASFSLLADMLAGNEILHAMILSQMGRIANSASPDAARIHSVVRDLLQSPDNRVRREAALTLGKLQDAESFLLLADLLDDADEHLAANAHWALMRISGRNFRPDRRRWVAWYAAEKEWWATRGAVLMGTIASGRSREIAMALNELSTHRLFRHEVAHELRPLLFDRHSDIVLLCCTALRTLGSAAALTELAGALEHPDPRVVAAAHGALTDITGRDLPPDPRAWKDALESF